uniref:AAA+ ATPase domain-containing protein n=1 Tax=Phlebotomus papatasi TaxID=29031 RepID=A0A1B0DRE9_PHLPP
RITSALRNLQTGREFKVPKKVSRKRSSRDVTEVPPQKKSLSDDWLQTFAPKKAEDLAVHANKIQEVAKWLEISEENFSKKPNPILLLTGPAGCGKTATVVALAAEKDYNLVEWVTPIDTFRQYRDADEEGIEVEESKSEKFREFLFQASRFKSLFRKSNKRLLVVEDFPNFLLRDPQAFSSILDTWQISGRCPLIFIVTETKSKQLNISFNLFPDSLRSEYKISHISFNPISLTLMKKALQRITSALKEEPYSQVYKQPVQEVVDSVISSAMGDIRNAILNLQFVSQKDAILTIDIERVEGQKKGKGKTSAKLKTVGRDETITLMHALGRVFNPK